jgi:hypothetical protein
VHSASGPPAEGGTDDGEGGDTEGDAVGGGRLCSVQAVTSRPIASAHARGRLFLTGAVA